MEIFRNRLGKGGLKKLIKRFDNIEELKHLGSGSFANVYKFGRDKVIRVEDHTVYGHYEWITKVVLKSKSRHVPKVYFYGIIEDEDGDLHNVTVMEKLLVDTVIGYQVECFYGGCKTKLPKNVRGSLTKLYKYAGKRGLSFCDIHDENVMVRKDGTIVVTDPET